jgi:hypothetical protein
VRVARASGVPIEDPWRAHCDDRSLFVRRRRLFKPPITAAELKPDVNDGDVAVEVTFSGQAVQLNDGNAVTKGRVHLEPRDVAILHQSHVP